MSDLDKKLEDILNDTYAAGSQDPDLEMYGANGNDLMAIKQAFIDEGWVKLNVKEGDYVSINAKQYRLDGSSLTEIEKMTGQDWYDRLRIEFIRDESVSFNGDILAVARRAAGIE